MSMISAVQPIIMKAYEASHECAAIYLLAARCVAAGATAIPRLLFHYLVFSVENFNKISLYV